KVKKVSFANIVTQIVLIDIIFSFDSILTAVGLSGNILIMVSAVIISMILMMVFSGAVSDFINRNPTIKMLALGFLIVIGGLLTSEAIVDGINIGHPHKAAFYECKDNKLKQELLELDKHELLKLSSNMEVKAETEVLVTSYMKMQNKEHVVAVKDIAEAQLEHMDEIHINKNYIYFALAFCLFIEGLNMRERKKKKERNFGD
ncbi:MAG: hypothetical protein IAF38_19030, partial [Bacteroidia bacterium]|nr:hypothetical protein [Bacteroidia bacterium]